jgi:uncharacterized membrane protein YheB (UPF0754 family)
MARIGRNQPCPCGSGKKYKKCCYGKNNINKILLSKGFGKNFPKDVVITANPQKEKMSEVLLEFAKPLTDECETEKAFYNALQISAIAWNSSFLSPGERNKLIDESINKYINYNNERAMAKEILSKMLERKKKKFPNINRMIMDFQISYRDGQQHLEVISSAINE